MNLPNLIAIKGIVGKAKISALFTVPFAANITSPPYIYF